MKTLKSKTKEETNFVSFYGNLFFFFFFHLLEGLDALCYFNAQAIIFLKHLNDH